MRLDSVPVHPTRIACTVLALVVAGLFAGCGDGGSASTHTASNREVALQRAQFTHVLDGLRSVEGSVTREVRASRVAWPSIASGLPQAPSPSLRAAIATAATSAGALPEPAFMKNAARLTGPAAGIAGIYENYERLAERGWRLTEVDATTVTSGTHADAEYARANSPLYIDAIYDAHFDLSLLGKSLMSGYERLGGSSAFGTALTQSELTALAAAYSVPAVRLSPHPAGTAKEG